jgi:protocatechuate 3,4-dioxygenase beta subunit
MSDGADNQRLIEIYGRLLPALHGFARDANLTNDELMAAIRFLGEVADVGELVLLCDVLGVSQLVDDQTHAGAEGTANNVLGPFYVPGAPWVENPGAIARNTGGTGTIRLTGRITNAGGDPIADAVVDIWQADSAGRYSNEVVDGDPWELRGRQRVAADGTYDVTTVRPKHYTVKHDGPVGRLLKALGRHPWRPAHVHYLVTAPGYRDLVTQAYPAGGPYLDDDAISGVRESLIVPVADGRMHFDIKLARA